MPESRLTGRIALVTGGSRGIGREVVRELAWRGAAVLSASRASGPGEAIAAEIRYETGNEAVAFLPVDLASLDDVRALAESVRARYGRLDLLLNHAGAYFGTRTVTADGYEATFAIHHLAHFLLTLELEPLLAAAGADGEPARVVTTTSGAARSARLDFEDLMLENGYAGFRAYARSKLANQAFALELADRWRDLPIVAHAFHPGLVDTDIGPEGGIAAWVWRRAQAWLGKSPIEGAQTALFLLGHPEAARSTGGYWVDERRQPPAPGARDAAVRRTLWERSVQLVGVSDA